jgi:hypothetical protein
VDGASSNAGYVVDILYDHAGGCVGIMAKYCVLMQFFRCGPDIAIEWSCMLSQIQTNKTGLKNAISQMVSGVVGRVRNGAREYFVQQWPAAG